MVYKRIGQNWLNLTQIALLLVSVEAKSYNAVNKKFSVKEGGRCEVVLSSNEPLTYHSHDVIQVADGHTIELVHMSQPLDPSPLCEDKDYLVSRDTYVIFDSFENGAMIYGYDILYTAQGHQITLYNTGNSQSRYGDLLHHYRGGGEVLSGTGPFLSAKGAYSAVITTDMRGHLICSVKGRLSYTR